MIPAQAVPCPAASPDLGGPKRDAASDHVRLHSIFHFAVRAPDASRQFRYQRPRLARPCRCALSTVASGVIGAHKSGSASFVSALEVRLRHAASTGIKPGVFENHRAAIVRCGPPLMHEENPGCWHGTGTARRKRARPLRRATLPAQPTSMYYAKSPETLGAQQNLSGAFSKIALKLTGFSKEAFSSEE